MSGAQERVSRCFEAHRAEPANAEGYARGRESSLAVLPGTLVPRRGLEPPRGLAANRASSFSPLAPEASASTNFDYG